MFSVNDFLLGLNKKRITDFVTRVFKKIYKKVKDKCSKARSVLWKEFNCGWIMSDKKFTYFQYRMELGYQVFLRFDDADFAKELKDTVEVLGFNEVDSKKVKKIGFKRNKTRILKISRVGARVARRIDQVGHSGSMFGAESLQPQAGYDVYRYRGVGMMIFGENNYLWELGLKDNLTEYDGIRIVLTRFIGFALANQGVIGFWGVPVEEGFVVMKAKDAKAESIFVDVKKGLILTYNGAKPMQSNMQILRLDSSYKNEVSVMRRETLLSFLSMNTCYFSYNGFEPQVKEALYEISSIAQGIIYPTENFKPRTDTVEI